MAIEIVDFPMKNGGSFHSYGTVYQRVTLVYGRYFTNYSYIMVVINHVFFQPTNIITITFGGPILYRLPNFRNMAFGHSLRDRIR
jgi:hypothetical protein